jgi:hypothetical protein
MLMYLYNIFKALRDVHVSLVCYVQVSLVAMLERFLQAEPEVCATVTDDHE